ncbi:MAG: hypothetical protein LQ351_007800 [Letrouitia transgressa]|nr:MAG: hypothetical protein LQ351_007800 [Letrouitia transgressa]
MSTSSAPDSISRRASTRIATALATSPAKRKSHLEHSPSISAPEPPRRLLHLSELLDIREMLANDDIGPAEAATAAVGPSSDNANNNTNINTNGSTSTGTLITGKDKYDGTGTGTARLIVHSPSGQALDPLAYSMRPDRPLTMAERRERIREGVRRATPTPEPEQMPELAVQQRQPSVKSQRLSEQKLEKEDSGRGGGRGRTQKKRGKGWFRLCCVMV